MQDFSQLLEPALTPVTLISGVGLLLLSMVNRYNHAINRIRELLRERRAAGAGEHERISRSIGVIYERCKVMRHAIRAVASSLVSSGAMIFTISLEGLLQLDLFALKALFLVISIGLVVLATVLFVIEITYSLRALEIDMEP